MKINYTPEFKKVLDENTREEFTRIYYTANCLWIGDYRVCGCPSHDDCHYDSCRDCWKSALAKAKFKDEI